MKKTHLLFLSVLAATHGVELEWPPKLPDGKAVRTDHSDVFLKHRAELKEGVEVAKVAPTVDFLYFDAQTYAGKPWSVWGDGLAVEDKFYTSIGDHLAPMGNAFVYEYDAGTKQLRLLSDVRSVLKRPEGWYTPGKIHSRIDV